MVFVKDIENGCKDDGYTWKDYLFEAADANSDISGESHEFEVVKDLP
jgi:hypothetical protein